MRSDSLLILGASARAAAFSAARCGLSPHAVDRFADRDLAKLCPVTLVEDYPAGLERAARHYPPMPWIYTGALENCPELVDRIACGRPLYGNPGEVLTRVRDPWRVAEVLRSGGWEAPRLSPTPDRVATLRWVCKPLHSAGGNRMRFADPRRAGVGGTSRPQHKKDPAGGSCYYQEFIEGLPCSGAFVAAGGTSQLLGMTQQLVGCDWAGADGFRYVGSIGLPSWKTSVLRQAENIGETLARHFRLRGLFGVDFILQGERLWTIEVNPRYTASLEVLERGTPLRVIEHHVRACRDKELAEIRGAGETPAQTLWGKAICYALADLQFPESVAALCRFAGLNLTEISDLPQGMTGIPAGQPIITVWAEGGTSEEVVARLAERAERVGTFLLSHSRPV